VADSRSLHDIAAVIARRRVAAGFILGALVFWFARPTPRTLAIGAVVAIAGEVMRIWAAGHLEKGREVTASGPYALTRHPLYLGSALIAAGIVIAAANVAIAIVVATYFAVTITAAIRTEEAQLTERFGAQYPAYREGRSRTVRRRFSAARAIRNREYRALAGLALALALLAWKTMP